VIDARGGQISIFGFNTTFNVKGNIGSVGRRGLTSARGARSMDCLLAAAQATD